jgi:predicted Zn-dependent protease
MLMAALGVGAQYGILMPYSRVQESEADRLGLDLMARAGFDPAQSIELWKNMSAAGGEQPPEFLSTHPSHSTRISDLRAHLPEAQQLQRTARQQGKRPACKP